MVKPYLGEDELPHDFKNGLEFCSYSNLELFFSISIKWAKIVCLLSCCCNLIGWISCGYVTLTVNKNLYLCFLVNNKELGASGLQLNQWTLIGNSRICIFLLNYCMWTILGTLLLRGIVAPSARHFFAWSSLALWMPLRRKEHSQFMGREIRNPKLKCLRQTLKHRWFSLRPTSTSEEELRLHGGNAGWACIDSVQQQ